MAKALRAGRDLELRPLALADAAELFALVDANRARLRKWLPWLDTNTKAAHTRAFIAERRALEAKGMALTFTLRTKGKLAGMIGFNWIDPRNRCAAIGYWIAEGFEGQGLVTRAVARLMKHGFEDLGFHRIEIRAAVRNRRSRAVPERLGFRHEGTLHDAEWLYDRFVDHAVYGLITEG
jgi:ribosomal-protein-serine acetyltransferase